MSRQQLAEIREHQARQVQALERAVKLSSERYVAGKASYYEVLEAQQQLFPSELNLARTQRDELVAVVALYKTLGGGWQDERSRPGILRQPPLRKCLENAIHRSSRRKGGS